MTFFYSVHSTSSAQSAGRHDWTSSPGRGAVPSKATGRAELDWWKSGWTVGCVAGWSSRSTWRLNRTEMNALQLQQHRHTSRSIISTMTSCSTDKRLMIVDVWCRRQDTSLITARSLALQLAPCISLARFPFSTCYPFACGCVRVRMYVDTDVQMICIYWQDDELVVGADIGCQLVGFSSPSVTIHVQFDWRHLYNTNATWFLAEHLLEHCTSTDAITKQAHAVTVNNVVLRSITERAWKATLGPAMPTPVNR